MHTMDTMGYGHKKYRPPISPTSFYQPDYYSRHTTLRPQSEYRFAGGGYPRVSSSGGKRSSGLCSAALVGGALLAAVAVLGVAALAFYMGALRPDNGEPMMTFDGTLRVTRGDVYGGAPGSAAWRERVRRYGLALRQIYASAPSVLRPAFAGAVVTGFGDRKLDVHFKLYLDRRKIPSSVSNIEETLKNILIQDINSKHPVFGSIKIDTSSIVIKRDLEHTYHSESYVKEALNESMSVNNLKAGATQNAKDKTLQTRVGVVRKTTLKPQQSKDSDEPDIDTKNLPVVQGTFQITKTDADITENKQNASPTVIEDKTISKSTAASKIIPTTKSSSTTPPSTTPLTTKMTTTTAKPRRFTITSTLNIKPKTDPTPKRKLEKITTTTRIPNSENTTKTPSTTVTVPSTTQTTTNNVSQILLDLLTNENHYKDLPKIDSLFTVPHVIDNEPWRPITRPYYDSSESSQVAYEVPIDQNAEDRIGVAEVVEDVSDLESSIPLDQNKEKPIHNSESKPFDNRTPKPTYTSFTLPTYAPPIKGMETLGSSYPKPHPLPVDKISSVVEDTGTIFDTDDDGKPVQRPPKDKKTSAILNIIQMDQPDNSTEKVSVEGTSIIKRHNDTKESSENKKNISDATSTDKVILSSTTQHPEINVTKEISTRRPNDKVSLIPTTNALIRSWELINTSANDNNTLNKGTPEKYYNDTLQAIITKNDVVLSTTPKFNIMNSVLRNLTEVIKKYSHNSTSEHMAKSNDENNDNVDDEEEQEQQEYAQHKVTGLAEVVLDEELPTTSERVITLLPAKSNLGVNRPLRPRPKISNQSQRITESKRSLDDIEIANLNKSYIPKINATAESEIVISKAEDNYYIQLKFTSPIEKFNINENDGTSNTKRFPKSSDDLNDPHNEQVNKSKKQSNAPEIPDGTYRVSYHVTGSVSSKQANKTKKLPSYELALEPDVVVEIPLNQSNTLTAEKLKQLASLATISSTNNSNSIFPGNVIFTKAIPSTYTVNQAGLKILTKIYNKLPSSKFDEIKEKNIAKNDPKKIIIDGTKNEQCDNATSFRCASGLCLPVTSRCNRLLDCPGGDDEHLCTCADYLRAENSHSKICDEIVDCWDYSDENKCEWCEEGQYVCANARQCVDKTQVCDGTPDCPLGDDEKSCIALGDDIENNEVIPYNEEGFLMVRKRGVWGRLCVDSFSEVVAEAHSFLQLPDLGRAVCRAMTFQDSPWAREAREGRKASTVGYWEVWHNPEARAADTRLTFRRSSCPRKRALRVRCDGLNCGIRPHADAQQGRRVTGTVRWSRVVGGGGAAEGAWPWAAALYRNGDFQCGGTLITAQWLLSASHCFYQATDAEWVARLGALRRGSWPRAPWEHTARIVQVVLHPRYAARGFRNDIALLRVPPVPLHARLRPACLPPTRAPPPAGQHCTVIGWGQLKEHERIFPDTLQEVYLPVLSSAECQRRTRRLPLYRVTNDMFCAGFANGGHDACLGDSGGPLMCQEADNKWYVYGITSNGFGCARANHPGVYTKVSHYIEWIESVMGAFTPPTTPSNDTEDDTSEESIENDFFSDLQTSESMHGQASYCKGHRCPLGECLPASSVCNGFIECSDGSDEKQCDEVEPSFSSPENPD